VSTIEQAEKECSETAVGSGKDLRMCWIEDRETRTAFKKNLQKSKKTLSARRLKKTIFGRYQFDLSSLPENFKVFHNGGVSEEAPSAEYLTIFPCTDNIPGQFIRIASRSYVFDKELLITGWKPHCIKILCQTEPKRPEFDYDRECWHACQIVFENLDAVRDYDQCTTLMKLLSTMEEANYNLKSFCMSLKPPILHAACEEIKDLMELLNDYYEAVCLMKFTDRIHKMKLELR
jgi:hypothetical protein